MIFLKLERILFKLYLMLPGSQYFFQWIKEISVPSYKWRKYLRFTGAFKLTFDDTLQLKMMNYGNTIENELFWLGSSGWEARATQIWKKLSEQSSVIFDVGANTGLYSLISAKVNSSASVYAFEPLENVMNRLKKNLKLNDLSVHTHMIALADEDGEGKIFALDTISDTFDQASLNPDKYKGAASNYLIIKKKKLSTFIEEQQIGQIDLMKIDVETFEPQVLRGMGQYLKIFAPTLLIEILNEKVGLEVERLIKEMYYEYYLIDEKKGFIKKKNLTPNKRGNNFLLLNKEKHSNFEIYFEHTVKK